MRAFAVVAAIVLSQPIRACHDPDRITVTWTSSSEPGVSGVEFVGCSDWRFDVGGYNQLLVDPGADRCGLMGWRHGVDSPTDAVWLARQGDQRVDFDLRSDPLSGLGLRVAARDDSIVVGSVEPGSHAAEAGLDRGSRILAIDGVSTLAMPIGQFARIGVGEPGTVVELEFVDSGGEYHVANIERQQFLD